MTDTNDISSWIDAYQRLAINGVRSPEIGRKIGLELRRFAAFFSDRYGHERLSVCLKRDVIAWRDALTAQGLAPATVNHHLATLSAFVRWAAAQDSRLFPHGIPTHGVAALPLPPLEPRALSDRQVASLKNLCDRLPAFYRRKGRRWQSSDNPGAPLRANARPYRDRALVFVLLSTGLRREELTRLNLGQLEPNTPAALRHARRAVLTHVRGKGRTQRDVFLSVDARYALADYLEREYPHDCAMANDMTPLFLSAATNPTRSNDGRLSPRSINAILEQIGRWHDAEHADPERHISPLRPHDLRHTFAFRLARTTGADAYELERRLGHRSERYLQRYTNPPRDVAAGYVEDF
jgi:integrase